MNKQIISCFSLVVLLLAMKAGVFGHDQLSKIVSLIYIGALYALVRDLNVRVLIVACILARGFAEGVNYLAWTITVPTLELHTVVHRGIALLTMLLFPVSQLYIARYRIVIMEKICQPLGIGAKDWFPTYADNIFIRFFKFETFLVCSFIFYYIYLAFSIGYSDYPKAHILTQHLLDAFKRYHQYIGIWALIVELLFIAAVFNFMSRQYEKELSI
ncbi:MAG: hypothetical protein ACFHVJ_01680 [Aestuariibacter sp.]